MQCDPKPDKEEGEREEGEKDHMENEYKTCKGA